MDNLNIHFISQTEFKFISRFSPTFHEQLHALKGVQSNPLIRIKLIRILGLE